MPGDLTKRVMAVIFALVLLAGAIGAERAIAYEGQKLEDCYQVVRNVTGPANKNGVMRQGLDIIHWMRWCERHKDTEMRVREAKVLISSTVHVGVSEDRTPEARRGNCDAEYERVGKAQVLVENRDFVVDKYVSPYLGRTLAGCLLIVDEDEPAIWFDAGRYGAVFQGVKSDPPFSCDVYGWGYADGLKYGATSGPIDFGEASSDRTSRFAFSVGYGGETQFDPGIATFIGVRCRNVRMFFIALRRASAEDHPNRQSEE